MLFFEKIGLSEINQKYCLEVEIGRKLNKSENESPWTNNVSRVRRSIETMATESAKLD